MSKKGLFTRKIIDELLMYLNTKDILVLHGSRQVGKTSILYYLMDMLEEKKLPVYYADLEDSRLKAALDAGPDEFVKHLKSEGFDTNKRLFVFIDEIQYLENPSSFLKLVADHHRNLKLIVSGSSSFDIKTKFRDSLVGRALEFEVFNLSFEEFLIFKGKTFPIDINSLSGKKTEDFKSLYREFGLYGGYPKVVLAESIALKEKYIQQIIDTYVKKDIRDLTAVKDVSKFNRLLEVLASQSGNLLNSLELANTCQLARQTVEKYLFMLENTYVIKLVRPYSANIRSELFKAPKIFFYDTGLMQLLWLKSLPREMIGNVFEISVFAELIKKYGRDSVMYWRSKDKKEIDFILKRRETLLPIEVKLNFERFEPKAVKYFKERYAVKEHRLVGFAGKPGNKFSIYPWQL